MDSLVAFYGVSLGAALTFDGSRAGRVEGVVFVKLLARVLYYGACGYAEIRAGGVPAKINLDLFDG